MSVSTSQTTRTCQKTIDRLIINSPYEEPGEHWSYDRDTRTFSRIAGRRSAGYIRATLGARAFDDPGEFIALPLVNRIRERVKAWRENQYAGTTGITKRLLEHWNDAEQRGQDRRLFFCQLETMETLIWLLEASAAERQGIEIPGDGGDFVRWCAKMATGSGKTIVMAMSIAWQVINKVTYPQDARYSKNIVIIAPGLTVKNRLQVLLPAGENNFYQEFDLVPAGLLEKLRQGKVLILNWHKLMPEDPNAGPRVMKKGPESDEAFTRRVLEDLANAQNLLVINDEAHHAWRVSPKVKIAGIKKEDIKEATQWIGGLDRIHKTRGILKCFDFTATPFAPTGKMSSDETLFDWVVSDFGLNDAIESGLVKTPRVVVRDDGRINVKNYKSRLYHIYMDPEVKGNLNRKAQEHEPLPDLVRNAYYLLGTDWLETYRQWKQQNYPVPPVMITVANRTETAARVGYAFTRGKIHIDDLNDPATILHIDSKVLDKAEALDEAPAMESNDETGSDDQADEAAPEQKKTKKQNAEFLRRQVDTVGQAGKPGSKIRSVISVGMLSEGWDAKNVTHIMGLRAFTSQLLCEQVVGRGLRRTSYEVEPKTGLFEPEYVNIFGVPFTFLPHEGGTEGVIPLPPQPKIKIEAVPEKREFEISWPNIIRIDHVYRPQLKLDLSKVNPLVMDAQDSALRAELARILDGKPDLSSLKEIDLEYLARELRMQQIIFKAAQDVYEQMKPAWKANREYLLAQVVGIVEQFLASDRILFNPPEFGNHDLRRRIMLSLGMTKIVQHIWQAIQFGNSEILAPVFDTEHPIRSTGDMLPWFTGRPHEIARKSHINFCVYDSGWEASEAFELDRNPNVVAWVKNDHLGFEIVYISKGIVRKYRPDFLIRLKSGKMLVLEVKGQETEEDRTKREFLALWVEAVNAHSGFGSWSWAVSHHTKDIRNIIEDK